MILDLRTMRANMHRVDSKPLLRKLCSPLRIFAIRYHNVVSSCVLLHYHLRDAGTGTYVESCELPFFRKLLQLSGIML